MMNLISGMQALTNAKNDAHKDFVNCDGPQNIYDIYLVLESMLAIDRRKKFNAQDGNTSCSIMRADRF